MTTETTAAATEVTATETKAKKPAKAKQPVQKEAVAPAPAKAGDLTGNMVKVLKALKAKSPQTRKQLAAKTGIAKGWSRMLGATTKEDGGTNGANSLEGRGLIKVTTDPEAGRTLLYTLTKKGEQALAKATA